MSTTATNQTGIVKFFKQDKGYGFITDQSGNDIFVHITGCKGSPNLKKDDHVKFDVQEGKRGLNAVNVMKS
jgi:cold shock protein